MKIRNPVALTFCLMLALALSGVARPAPTKTPKPKLVTAPTQTPTQMPTETQAAALRFPTTPVKPPGGGKWRIGYLEGGDFDNYPKNLVAVVRGLESLGWLKLPEITPLPTTPEALWRFLAKHVRSDYLEFVAEAYWSDDFDQAVRAQNRRRLSARFQKGDLDLMLAMGTWASQDMVALGVPVPTVTMSVSDAVGSGIVTGVADARLPNLNVRIAPERYLRQLKLFHEIVPFKRLGLIYEDSQEGRTYAALNEVRQAAAELGFQLVLCRAAFSGVSQLKAEQEALACYRQLAEEADAIYVTVHRGTSTRFIPQVAQILREAKLPSFSMRESNEVKAGILLSMVQANYLYVGLKRAEAIARILNGARPSDLNQVWVDPLKIALNLKTARLIGFDPPIEVLLAADEVYEVERE